MSIFVDDYSGTRDDYGTLTRLGHEVVIGRSLTECFERPLTDEELSEAVARRRCIRLLQCPQSSTKR